ncbi:transcriptional repressor CTCF-like [Phlebotomus argentipes]|uniref:transcriptional repressor CTCF-like n=1 Tax=Phlebotomus argentipes TaxID=94469 RepID=UPI002893700B|nr:transcriptional repressor CTCF-like [Phlebotomus argentipes]
MDEKPNTKDLKVELKNMRICRFCLNRNEPLTNIYSIENRLNRSVPLPLQIMACVAIEVFVNDGMPSWICEGCRVFMEHWYRFKQICKKSDTHLRQFHLTGDVPDRLELPLLPAEFHKALGKHQTPAHSSPSTSTTPSPSSASQQAYKRPRPQSAQTTPLKKPRQEVFEVTSMGKTVTITKNVKSESPPPVKLLNKSPRILNKPSSGRIVPMLSEPIIKTNESGTVEIITEVLDNMETYNEPDPIKFAPPVETNVFPCPHCERSFPLRQLLDIHVKNHTRERGYECAVCEKRFFSKYDLGKHMLTHTGERPYECVVCRRSFSRSTLLHRHEKIHTDQPKYLCGYCERPFLSVAELEKHSEKHRKNRPFHCKECDKSFAFKQGLERHEVVHAKDQPYPCEYCDKSFSTPSKLARHLTAHAGHRPFPCKMCPKSYVLSHHLTRHMRSHMNSVATYNCFDCGSTFSSRDELIYHSAVHATQSLVCPLCKEQFGDLDEVTEHIKSHTEGDQYACEFCDLIFTTEEKLNEHTSGQHFEDQQKYGPTVKQDDEEEEETLTEEVIEEYVVPEEDIDSIEPKVKQEKVERVVKTTPTMIKCTYGKSSAQKKAQQENQTSEAEIRRSARAAKVRNYADLSQEKLDDEEDEEFDKETMEEDFSPDDENYKTEEEPEEEEELPKSKKKAPRGGQKGSSTQQKISDVLREAGKKSQASTNVQDTLKGLPKGVTVTKRDATREKQTYGGSQGRRVSPGKPEKKSPAAKPREKQQPMERKVPKKEVMTEEAPKEKTTEIKIGNQILKVKKVVMMRKGEAGGGASTSKGGK